MGRFLRRELKYLRGLSLNTTSYRGEKRWNKRKSITVKSSYVNENEWDDEEIRASVSLFIPGEIERAWLEGSVMWWKEGDGEWEGGGGAGKIGRDLLQIIFFFWFLIPHYREMTRSSCRWWVDQRMTRLRFFKIILIWGSVRTCSRPFAWPRAIQEKGQINAELIHYGTRLFAHSASGVATFEFNFRLKFAEHCFTSS